MKNRALRSIVSTSLLLGSTLLLGLAAAGCSSSSSGDGPGSNAGGCAAEALTAPADVPAIVQTPSGATLIDHFHAVGTQDYKCTAPADAATAYAWVFIAPEAVLSDACGTQVGTHYAGPGGAATPRWQFTADNSFVQGMKVQSSPVAGSIPELLLARTDSSPAGTLANVTYVQRLAPVGGAAPDAADCAPGNVDEVRKADYSAEYYFYTGGAAGSAY